MRKEIAIRQCQDNDCDLPDECRADELGGCLCSIDAIAALTAIEALGFKLVQNNLLEECINSMTQLEVIGPYAGFAWLHLRPDHKAGKGFVSIRLGADDEEIAMQQAYVNWFSKVKDLRKSLSASPLYKEPSNDA